MTVVMMMMIYLFTCNLYYGVPLTSLRCDDDGGDDDDDDLPVHL